MRIANISDFILRPPALIDGESEFCSFELENEKKRFLVDYPEPPANADKVPDSEKSRAIRNFH